MTIYREKLWPAPWLYIATALVMPASLLVFVPINIEVGIVVAIVLYAACVALLILTSPVVAVTDTHVLAGKAKLPLSITGSATAYRGEQASFERGRHLDARAWLLIRGWISPVVKVEVLDINDPAPYWLISTRTPEKLVAAITEATTAHHP